jgi:hypothetical protein
MKKKKVLKNKSDKLITKKLKKYITDVKKNSICEICGESRWYTLDFHHIDKKTIEISTLVRIGCSLDTLLKEMSKCIIVCSNCHRELHYLEKHKK